MLHASPPNSEASDNLSNLKSAMVRAFTPQKSPSATNQGFLPPPYPEEAYCLTLTIIPLARIHSPGNFYCGLLKPKFAMPHSDSP